MADTELAVNDDAQAEFDLKSGFDGEAPPPTKPAGSAPTPEPKKDQVPPKVEKAPAKPADVAPPPEAPKYVQLTQDQFDRLESATSKMVTQDKLKDSVAGIVGELEQRIVKKLQSQTPTGEKVEVPKVAFAKLRESFPEVADLLEADMAENLKGLRGTGPEDEKSEPAIDPEALMKAAKAIDTQRQIEALEEDHPTWRDIVGTVDAEGKYDPNIEFRKWLVTQPVEYQTKINGTHSATVIGKAIDKFQTSKTAATPSAPAAPTPKQAAQKSRIEGAVQPKGDGGQPPPAKTANDDFREGFASG